MSIYVNVLNILAVLGVVLAIPPYVFRILDFLWLYFLRPSSVKHYLHGPAPYAIVTGATDGIGKATAAELLTRGFNVILHGRNEAKMKKVVEELRAAARGMGKADTMEIRYFIADAAKGGHDFAKLIEPFKDLHITVVVHNVGASDLNLERVDERPEEYIMSIVNTNAFFALFLTRTLLPQLRRAAQYGPVHVLFVGSLAGDMAPPRLLIYSASKAFLQSLARGLDNDERYCGGGAPTDVRFTYLAVGSVHSDNHDALMPPSLTVLTSARFGRAVVESIGCGRRRMAPYHIHAVHSWRMEAMGESIVDEMNARKMESFIGQAAKEKRGAEG